MKDVFELNREEAAALVRTLMREWVPNEDQRVIYLLVLRLEKELNER